MRNAFTGGLRMAADSSTPVNGVISSEPMSVDAATTPGAIQVAAAEVLVVPDPGAGEWAIVQVEPNQPLQFGFDLDHSKVRQTADGIEITTPSGGVVLLQGLTFG